MKKEKPLDVWFEDEVWSLFASMGFQAMNKDRNFTISYDSNRKNISKQIDVFAVDEETILFIECKIAYEMKKSSFKDDIEAIAGIRQGLFSEAKRTFPDRKIKYIFATKNYVLSDVDKERMLSFNIQHFDEKVIAYYRELVKHLGLSARYQLLGLLFAGEKIKGMETKVAAIEGKMGGHTYYSFNIEPEKLLKIGYVLHRNEANSSMMPTYQRIIKKTRLSGIQKFVNSGGFFPNSLIINIDTKSKLQFDLSSLQVPSSIPKIGILHLPQQYRTAYIIDGQHRLYGYVGSKYGIINTIPVVAFINLSKEEQIKLFMEINENQKSVPKNLQNTLNADLLWTSSDYNEQRRALRLHIAQELGDKMESPLYGRVIIGENEKTEICCITIETIQEALKKTNFLSQYGKDNALIKVGTFDKGTNDLTKDDFIEFLLASFDYIRENCVDEWQKGDGEGGILTVNVGIYALIRIFSDIVDLLINQKRIDPKVKRSSQVVEEIKYYLDPLIIYIDEVSLEDRNDIRKTYGGNGKTKAWRIMQKAIGDSRSEFKPDGLAEWWRNNAKIYNVESFSLITDIERIIKANVLNKLKQKYNEKWIVEIPKTVYTQASKIATSINYENSDSGTSVEMWDCISLADCQKIIINGNHWSDIFEEYYTLPGAEGRKGGNKSDKTQWLIRISKIREQQNSPTYSVTESDYELIKNVYDWLGKSRE